MQHHEYLVPSWKAPKAIHAFTTTRKVGITKSIFTDGKVATLEQKLRHDLNLPTNPIWLKQQHTNIALNAKNTVSFSIADASFVTEPNIVCAVLTADCIPILVCDRQATTVAAIHAGWKGIATGVIETTIKTLNLEANNLIVWLGPAIGPNKFEVGNEVRDLFIQHNPAAKQAFKAQASAATEKKWLADIYLLAKLRLQKFGITNIYGGEFCTYTQEDLFSSYRRNPTSDGRMASLIWIAK